MAKAFINNEMLVWAVNRSGRSVDELSEKLGASIDRVESWVQGDDLPTFKQAQRIANVLQVPFGYLYLPKPPTEEVPVAEFRRVPGVRQRVNKDVFDLLNDIEFKRDWYREYRMEEDFEPLDFVARYDVESSSLLVASDIRKELSRASNSLFATQKSYERFLDEFMRAAEKTGIWIMRSGVVGNNTHRPIPVDLLRGFAIADPIVPLVFLNGQDAKSAQIFTFAHELAHLWIGKSTIEFGDLSEEIPVGDKVVENKCNEIAAEVLVPRDEFAQIWNSNLPLEKQVDDLAQRFSVSRIVIARRALEQKYISSDDYGDFFALERQRWIALKATRGSGGSYYSTIPARNGKTFTKAVAREAAIGRLMYRDAGQLLGVQPSKVREIYNRSLD